MAFNFLESVAYIGIHSFGKINMHFAPRSTKYYYDREDPDSQEAQLPSFDPVLFKRSHHYDQPLISNIETICRKHQHPPSAGPIMLYLCRGIHDILGSSPVSAQEIVDDVVRQKEDSLTFAQFRKNQMNYFIDVKSFMESDKNFDGPSFIWYNVPYAMAFAKKIFCQGKSTLTASELDKISDEAKIIDRTVKPTWMPSIGTFSQYRIL